MFENRRFGIYTGTHLLPEKKKKHRNVLSAEEKKKKHRSVPSTEEKNRNAMAIKKYKR